MKELIAALAFSIIVTVTADPAWSDLRGSFLIFAPFPRTTQENLFISEGWAPTSSIENDCTNEGKFNGIQYVRDYQYDVGLLFDKNGIIAGIQMLILHEVVLSERNTYRYDLLPMYNNATYNGKEYFVLTMYFVDPTTICTTGRSEAALQTEGTGTGLYIQNGPGPESYLELPHSRPEGDEADRSGWTQNNCFPAMGYHNFYRQDKYGSTNCTVIDPIFGLYNEQNRLHGFGFITPGSVNSPRFEHAPIIASKIIIGKGRVPRCLLDMHARLGVSSIHVYMVPRPWLITCSISRALRSYASDLANFFRGMALAG